MQVPLLDLQAQYKSIKEEIDEVLMDVVKKQYFILSDEVKGLEKEVAAYSDTSCAAGVASGTDALILSLRALGLTEGDSVITAPFTFFATSEAASILGIKPLFVDIDPEAYNINPEKIIDLLQRLSLDEKSKVKAIIPVHLYGQSADMTKIMEIAKEHDLKVVEDACQAIGATHNGKKCGSFGDAGALSFFPSKNLGGFGDGGMVVSSDSNLVTEIKKLRVHGSDKQYIHDEIAYNSRLDSLQAAILRVKLRYLDKWISKRQQIAGIYNEAFKSLGIKTPKVYENNIHTYHQYTIAIDNRDRFQEYMLGKDIAVRVYYPVPLHLQPCYKDLGYEEGSFPVSEKASREVVSLPVYPELKEPQIEYIIQSVKEFAGKNA